MSDRPKEISFVKEFAFKKVTTSNMRRVVLFEKVGCPNALMSLGEIETFSRWIMRLEEDACSESELNVAIIECKEYYGEMFNKLFDEDILNQLHDNWVDICIWEMEKSIACD